MRPCSTCTSCCYTHEVPELSKPAFQKCEHSTGVGCSIYANRPASCRKFQCVWTFASWVPVELRPDLCHVVLDHAEDGKGLALLCESGYQDAWKEPKLYNIVERTLHAGREISVLYEKGAHGLRLAQPFMG